MLFKAISPAAYSLLPSANSFHTTTMAIHLAIPCLLYTSDAADERSSVDLGGRRIIKKKNRTEDNRQRYDQNNLNNKKDTTSSVTRKK